MDKMTLGGVTFDHNPKDSTVPQAKRRTSVVETYGGVAFFSWGTFVAGQPITIKCPSMLKTTYDSLQTLLTNDEQVPWNPQTGTTYNVQILKIDPKYFDWSLEDGTRLKNVTIELVIISAV